MKNAMKTLVCAVGLVMMIMFIGFATYETANWAFYTTNWDGAIVEEIYGALPMECKVIVDMYDRVVTIPMAKKCAMKQDGEFAGMDKNDYLRWIESTQEAMDNRVMIYLEG